MGAVVTTGISAYENRQGLAIGVGVAYGAQVSGARDWVADKAAKLVDGFKSWF